MIEKLFGNTITIVTVTAEESIRELRNAIMGKHPQITFLEDTTKYNFPQKFTLIYDWKLMTCCMVKVDKEFTV